MKDIYKESYDQFIKKEERKEVITDAMLFIGSVIFSTIVVILLMAIMPD
jgi:hypothetical protein